MGKTNLITYEGCTTYVRQTIYEPTSVDQSADGRRILELLTILKDNLVNLLETIVLHFPSDTDILYFLKLNILTLVVTVDIFLERAIIQYSQSGEEKFLVAGNLLVIIDGRIVLLTVVFS